MELTPLRYLVAIAEHGHMTRAADALGVSQPALSAALKKLEAEVGAPLFDRTGRGVEPTEAGRAMLEHARETLRSAQAGVEAVRRLAGLEHGAIRIGGGATATGYLLPGVVSAMRREHPGVRFTIREASSAAVAQGVVTGELEVGLVTLPVSGPDTGELLVVRQIEDELRLIVPPGHVLAGGPAKPRRSFRWADLEAEPVVGFEAASAVRDVIDAAASAHGVGLDVVMELRSIESIKRMVAAGVGVGFVSRFALGPDEGLTCRDGRVTRALGVIRRRDRQPSHATAAFERLLVAALRPPADEPG